MHRGAYAATELSQALGSLQGAERSLATDLVYGTLRHEIYLDAALAVRLREPGGLPDAVRHALRIGAYEKLIRETPPYALVASWVDVVKAEHPKLGGLVNAVLRRLAPPEAPDPATLRSLPPWLHARFVDALGERHADEAAKGMLEPGPVWLLVHKPRAAETLEREGHVVTPGPLPHTLSVRPAAPLADSEALRSGLVQPQNPASTVPVRLLAPRPGERAIDLASGRGVKTAQLAAAGARVLAVDASARRQRQARDNLARLGLDAEHLVADLRARPDVEPATAVLLDAPCTGSGTLRGNPEIKLRLGPDDPARLADLQRDMLDVAAQLVADGGRLVYSVCSLTPEEGRDQVAAFLSRWPDFVAQPLRPPLPHVPVPHGAYILPVDGLDGFFVALLHRGEGSGPSVRG